MRKYFLFSIFFSTFVACYSCDDGRIYEKEVTLPQEGLTLKLTGHLTGVDIWPEKYTLCVAGFTDESDYAVLSKVIASDHAAGGEVEVVLSEEGLVQHSHTDLLDAKKKSTLLTLINDWIDAGAKE